MPEPADGLALLWPEHDVVLMHAGRELALRADDLVLIDRAMPLLLTGRTHWTARLLDFGPRNILFRTDRPGRVAHETFDGAAPLALLIKRLWMVGIEIDRMGLIDEIVAARMTDAVGGVAGLLLPQDANANMSAHKAAMVERAEALIVAHLSDPNLSPAMLARKMRLSSRHLSSLFAAKGMTMTNAILTQRLARARSLLTDPSDRRRIADIAAACGFADQGYFTRLFRRHCGVTPKQFRESGKIQDDPE